MLRDWINKNSAVVTIGAVLMLIFSLVYIVRENVDRTTRPSFEVFYYDLGSDAPDMLDRLFSERDAVPPIPAPSGKMVNGTPAGVRARVYACGDCSDRSKVFIGFLETYDKQAKETFNTPIDINGPGQALPLPTEIRNAREKGHYISTDGAYWVLYESDDGTNILNAINSHCGDDELVRTIPCNPGSMR